MIPEFSLIFSVLALGIVLAALLDRRFSYYVGVLVTAIVLTAVLSIVAYEYILGTGVITQTYAYIPQFGVHVSFIATPISTILLVMAAVVLFAAAISSGRENTNRGSTVLMLIFGLASLGLFSASNLIMFFVFWDVGVIAMFFMISYMGAANRRSAALKFLVYSLGASAALLLGIILIYFGTPVHSFNIAYIISHGGLIPMKMQELIFALLFIAFMIKMPIFPLHSWMADAYTESSTQGSMLISGVLSKFGAYGMLLLFLMLPLGAKYGVYVLALAAISSFYAVFVAINQSDMKRLISYISMLDMSIILVGIASATVIGRDGSLYGMLAHGLGIALLFLVAGSIEGMFGSRSLKFIRGVVEGSAATAYSFMLGIFSMTGVPLTVGFVADLLIFLGAFGAFGLYGLLPLGAILIAGGLFYLVVSRSLVNSREKADASYLPTAEQKIGYAILLLFIFIFGMFPFILLKIVSL
ncbi:proton-translocating NADH-quinone oxidoreductase, chain M [mine drainage metagenome]|uniref:Proton-translocating NADH-quinone oxidoreductase, chain M n=1 Tax=mine drainage metagenome TaxID=410659 RepID=T1APP9_9ZZZZ